MKKYNPIYYLLCVFLALGTFAAMAQNEYGHTILGVVAACFSLLFIVQLVEYKNPFKKKIQNVLGKMELLSLSVIALLMCLRVFYIHFVFVEVIFTVFGLLLTMTYIFRSYLIFIKYKGINFLFAAFLILFHLSVAIYIISMVFIPFFPAYGEIAGILAFGLLFIPILGNLIFPYFLIEGESTSLIVFIARSKNQSLILASLFFLFSLYMGLTRLELLPTMYDDRYPQKYYEMQRNESGLFSSEQAEAEKFREAYDELVEKHKPEEFQ